jgi:3-deoxy-D-manno-octulosonic-acid transferase
MPNVEIQISNKLLSWYQDIKSFFGIWHCLCGFMIYLLYNIILTFILILSTSYFLLRSLVQKRVRKELAERIGFFPYLPVRRPVWVHAASVGEVFGSIPLLKRIKVEFPHCGIVLTTMTRTGNEAARNFIHEANRVLFFPIDHPLAVRRVIKRIQPSLLLIAETELWPTLLRSCGKNKVPIILFNGRISEKSFRRYHLFRVFFKECLKYISLFLMQTEEDRKRLIRIGASFEKTRVAGNLKFDQTFPSFTQEMITEMSRSLRLMGKETVLIAGSTHSGEEERLIGLFKELRKVDPHLVLLLAPRHLERLEEVGRILKKESIRWMKKTSLSMDQNRSPQELKEPPEVILLDTMGELMSLYSLGTVVFIGGSLVPVGGHNPIEPLFFKKCVLFGPHMFNFSEISQSLLEAGGAIQVDGEEDLFSQLKRLLSDEGARKEVGERGYQLIQRHRGATERMFEEIRPFLTYEEVCKLHRG